MLTKGETPDGFFDLFRAMVDGGHLKKLKAVELRVLMTLMHHRNSKTGDSFPSLDRMVRCAGGNRYAVVMALRKLEMKGFVLTVRKGGGNGHSTVRKVTVPSSETVQDSSTVSSPANSAQTRAQTVHDCEPNSTRSALKQCMNHVQEHQKNSVSEHQISISSELEANRFAAFEFEFQRDQLRDSPLQELEKWKVSPKAIHHLYEIGGTHLAQHVVDYVDGQFEKREDLWVEDGDDFPSVTRLAAKICWHPSPELVEAAQRARDRAKRETEKDNTPEKKEPAPPPTDAYPEMHLSQPTECAVPEGPRRISERVRLKLEPTANPPSPPHFVNSRDEVRTSENEPEDNLCHDETEPNEHEPEYLT